MNRRIASAIFIVALTLAMSTVVFASERTEGFLSGQSIFAEADDGFVADLLYLQRMFELHSYEFYQMGLILCMEYTLLSATNPQAFLQRKFRLVCDNATLCVDELDYVRNDSFCEAIFAASEQMFEEIHPSPPSILWVPRISRMPNTDSTITARDIDFLIDFITVVENIGIPIFFDECFYHTLKMQDMMGFYSARRFYGHPVSYNILYSQAYGVIVRHVETLHFSAGFHSIGQVIRTPRVFSHPRRITYSFSLDRTQTILTGFWCSATHMYLICGWHFDLMSGWRTVNIPVRNGPFIAINGGPTNSLMSAFTLTVF